ncbi:MAG: DUF4260 domain-containing protein [Chloroflexota bacterium]
MITDRTVLSLLRLEGVAAFGAGVALYLANGGLWLALIPLLLVPDVSMVGYLRDPKLGALLYNVAHNWALGLAVLGLGFLSGQTWLVIAGAVLVAHVGMDRVFGYGLKLPTSFQETHLGRIGKARREAAQS